MNRLSAIFVLVLFPVSLGAQSSVNKTNSQHSGNAFGKEVVQFLDATYNEGKEIVDSVTSYLSRYDSVMTNVIHYLDRIIPGPCGDGVEEFENQYSVSNGHLLYVQFAANGKLYAVRHADYGCQCLNKNRADIDECIAEYVQDFADAGMLDPRFSFDNVPCIAPNGK